MGGGGGGDASTGGGGGGGGGSVVFEEEFVLTSGEWAVIVGAGGAGATSSGTWDYVAGKNGGASVISNLVTGVFLLGKWCRDLVAYRGPNRLSFDLPWCRFSIAYVDGAIVEPGKPVRLGLRVESGHEEAASLLLFWHLPEGWTVSPGPSQSIMVCLGPNTDLEIMVTPGPMAKAVEHVLLEARLSNRQAPVFLTVPFRRKDAAVATTWRDWSTVANMINMRGGSFR